MHSQVNLLKLEGGGLLGTKALYHAQINNLPIYNLRGLITTALYPEQIGKPAQLGVGWHHSFIPCTDQGYRDRTSDRRLGFATL